GCSAEKAKALFVFGDSYADTGNHDPYNASINEAWRRPYGINWPGYPAGRYSSGKIQTDRWAEILGLPTPIAYQKLKTHNCEEIPEKIIHGINFAVGGSGIFKDYGYITVPYQVKQFKEILKKTDLFDAHDLARSVVLLSNAGNDYFAYLDSHNNNLTGLVNLVPSVVSGIEMVLKELYGYGFRNFVVSNVVALGCVPEVGRVSCDSRYEETVTRHDKLLTKHVEKLKSDLIGSNIIIPDLPSVTVYILSNAINYGFKDWFAPCCAIKNNTSGCAEVDEKGTTMFEVCEDPNKRFYWDDRHPTHKGWYTMMSLYAYGDTNEGKEVSFVKGAPNLIEWVKSIGFDAHNISSCDTNIEIDKFRRQSYIKEE
ncbi:hypothetical protein KI387_026170, partial [Taxus chinensis]